MMVAAIVIPDTSVCRAPAELWCLILDATGSPLRRTHCPLCRQVARAGRP